MARKAQHGTNSRRSERLLFSCLGCALGIIVTIIGTLCAVYELPKKFVDYKFRSALTLGPESAMYSDWVNPPVPIYMTFHIFNVTNREEIEAGGKPRVGECGPYVYRMAAPKFNLTFYPNDTVSFLNKFTLSFEPNMSSGSEDDVLHQLNVPLASLGTMTKGMSRFVDYFGIMDRVVKMSGGDKLFPAHTVREILFGYQDPIFSVLNKLSPFIGQKIDPYFGFFQNFNNSHDGTFLVYTGKRHYERAYQISRWNGKKYLDFWSTKYANMINGSDGSFLGPNLTPNNTPYLYFPQLCRSVKLEYEGKSSVKGIDTFQFHSSDDFLANATVSPDNAGFCVPPGNCFESGILNVESCTGGVGGFISHPHFYNSAPVYQNAIIGLAPNKEKHDSIYHAEPKTGAVLKSHRRLQINILLHPSVFFEALRNVRETVFPIMWVTGSAEIDDEVVANLSMAVGIVKYIYITSYVIIGTGCFTLFVFAFCAFKKPMTTTLRGSIPAPVKAQKETSMNGRET